MSDMNKMPGLPGWETVCEIGSGSFGKVYKIRREDTSITEFSALKVISIPHSQADIRELQTSGYDKQAITSIIETHAQNIVGEYKLMQELSDCANIVHCSDFNRTRHTDGIGWDILIRMELLTPLRDYLPAEFSEAVVIRLAKDMCSALSMCESQKIIHRDIKPENIFVSEKGKFKLGDFGIAKMMEKIATGTRIGTYSYMAPEVYNNQAYGHTADIYSLGLVLYWMLNDQRLPFIQPGTTDPDSARSRRLNGEPLPAPKNGSTRLKEIVLKACAFAKSDRYQSAEELRKDLDALEEPTDGVFPPDWIKLAEDARLLAEKREQEALNQKKAEKDAADTAYLKMIRKQKELEEQEKKKKKAKKRKMILLIILGVVFSAVSIFLALRFLAPPPEDEDDPSHQETASPTAESTQPQTPLQITGQPASMTVASGTEAKVDVSAQGDGLAYQWYMAPRGSDEFSPVEDGRESVLPVIMSFENNGTMVYCQITDQYGNTLKTSIVTLNVITSLKITNQPADDKAYVGEGVSTTVKAEGEGLTYQWYAKEPGEKMFAKSAAREATYSFQMTEEKSGRQVYCVITDVYGSTVTTNTVTFTKKTELKIIQQPTDVTALAGDGIKTSVKAQGDGLSYQWYAKEPGESEFAKSAARKATYEFLLTEEKSGRQVYCIITDEYGKQVQTNTVTFRIGTPLKIIQQPSDAAAFVGKGIATTVKAEGDGLTYQWYVKEPGSKEFEKSAARKATYSYEMTEEKSGRQVYCVVTDAYGNSVKTNTVTLTRKTELKIIQQPTDDTALADSGVETTIKAQGDGLMYQWYVKEPGSKEFVKSAARQATYAFLMTPEKNGRQVYCIVTDAYENRVQSVTVTFRLGTTLKILEQPTDDASLQGHGVSATVKAEGDGLTYQWYAKEPDRVEFEKSSARKATYSFLMTPEKDGRQVYCIVTDAYGNTIKTNTVTFEMGQELTMIKQPADDRAPLGSGVSTTVKIEGDGLTYQWYTKEPGETEFVKSASRQATYAFIMTAEKDGRQVYCVITDAYGVKARTRVVTFRKGTVARILRQPKDTLVNNGETATVTIEAEGDGLIYQWYYANPGESSFTQTGAFTNNTYSLVMNDSRANRRVYCVIVDEYGNSIKSNTVTLQQKTTLKITKQPTGMTVANGQTARITVEAQGDGLTYRWYFANAGSSQFIMSTAFGGNSYTIEMDSSRHGRRVYCEITDKYGNVVKSNVVTLYMRQ